MNGNRSISNVDRVVLAQALRAFAYGFTAVLLGRTLAANGASALKVGSLLACIVLGSALSSILLITLAKKVSRRTLYQIFYVILALAGLIIGLYPHALVIALLGLSGVLSTDANENGPATTLEQVMLAQGVQKSKMSKVFGRYNGVAALSGGLGSILQGRLNSQSGVLAGYKGFYLLTVIGILGFLLARSLTPAIELPVETQQNTTFRESSSRKLVLQLAGLFTLDATAGGVVSASFLAYYLTIRYHPAPSSLGLLFFATSFLSSISMFAAPGIAQKIGLVPTMVSTHLLSNLFLIIAAFCGKFSLAVFFLLLRSALSQMDVPTRQALIANVVPEDERMAAVAVTNTARYVVRPVSPLLGGLFQSISVGLPLIFCGVLKAAYDLGVYSWAKHHHFLAER